MPLVVANLGEEVTIQRCNVGKDRDLKRHMESLGLLPGESIKPISRNAGSLIIQVRNSRLAINMGLASKIEVA